MIHVIDLNGTSRSPSFTRRGNIYIGHAVGDFVNAHTDFTEEEFDYSFSMPEGVENYGVADSLEQIEQHIIPLVADTRRWLVYASEVCRDTEEPYSGWRWHKWGRYIGEKTPRCEYLNDEPEIERVWCFHVSQILDRQWTDMATQVQIGSCLLAVTFQYSGCRVRNYGCTVVSGTLPAGTVIDLEDIEAERDFGVPFDAFCKAFFAAQDAAIRGGAPVVVVEGAPCAS